MKFARFAMPVIALVTLAASASADTVRYLMTVNNVNTNNPFAVQSFSWGISNPVSFSNGGISTGRPSLSSFNIMKSFDQYDPALIDACFRGQHIDNARFRGFKGTNPTPFLDIIMEDVFIESHQMSGSTSNVPACSVSMAFVKISINGVILDTTILTSNPQALNNMIAMITQKALAPTTATKQTKKTTVH